MQTITKATDETEPAESEVVAEEGSELQFYKIGETLNVSSSDLVSILEEIRSRRNLTARLHTTEGKDPYQQVLEEHKKIAEEHKLAFEAAVAPYMDKMWAHSRTMSRLDEILRFWEQVLEAVEGDEIRLPVELVKDGKFAPFAEEGEIGEPS